MKLKFIKNNIRLLLIITVFTPVLLSQLNPQPIYAIGITLNPASATVGSEIQVNAEGFSGRLATIYFDKKIVAKDVRIQENGNFTHKITVPKTYKGTHVVRITDDSNWSGSTAEVDFTVKPSITVFPEVTKKHSEVTITGNGFSSGEKNINITIDGKVVATTQITSDENGYWSTLFTISEIDRGEHIIGAASSASDSSEINTVNIIVTPFVKVTPLSGPVGTQLFVYGWGFRGNEDGVSMTWDDEIIKVNIRAEIDGSLIVDGSKVPHSSTAYTGDTRDTIYVPPSTQGDHVFGVYGSSFTPRGTFNDTIFKVIPNLSLTTEPDIKGTRIIIDGTGFGASELVLLSINKSTTNNNITTDNNGSFSTELVIQTEKGKEYVINGAGNKGNTAQASFVSSRGQYLPVEINLVSPANGATITLYDSVGAVLRNSLRYISGFISYMRGSPAQSNTLADLRFAWTGSSGTDTTFTIQVAKNGDFKSIDVEANTGNKPEYTVKPEDKLSIGNYSWRVKAISSSGSEGTWSKISTFEIVPTSTLVSVLTIIVVILIIAAVAIGILTAWTNLANR